MSHLTQRVLYIRNFANKVNPDSYNLQEIGFGKALVRKGFNCDVIYYNDTDEKKVEEIYHHQEASLRLIWMKGIKILSNSIFSKILNNKFLGQYDLIITTEYNQLMTYLLSKLCAEKLILYHGPYGDNNNILIRKIFDRLLLPNIRRKIRYNFVKSDLAGIYLNQKGFENVFTLGVGLDRDKIEGHHNVSPDIEIKLQRIKDKKTLLYIGVLEDRRNILFLLDIFKRLHALDQDYRLIIIGDGKKDVTDKYWNFIYQNHLDAHIVYIPKVDQKYLWQVYKVSDLMLFPTAYDIFGMVLLECLYFQVPVLSSVNGGASTIHKKNLSGVFIEDLQEQAWVNQIMQILTDNRIKDSMNSEQVSENFSWDHIADEMLKRVAF